MLNVSLIQPLPVAVAVVCYMFLGFLWYSPIFGAQWLKIAGICPNENKGAADMLYPMLLSIFTGIAMACVISMATASYNLPMSLEITFVLWLAFNGLATATNHAFGARPMALWAIESGYILTGSLLMTVIINQMHS